MYSIMYRMKKVGRVFICKEERRSGRCTPPLLLAMQYALYSSSPCTQSSTCCTPHLLLTMEYTLYFLSPIHDGGGIAILLSSLQWSTLWLPPLLLQGRMLCTHCHPPCNVVGGRGSTASPPSWVRRWGVRHLLHCKDEEYDTHSIVNSRGVVCCILHCVQESKEYKVYSITRMRGQAWHPLHCKIEDDDLPAYSIVSRRGGSLLFASYFMCTKYATCLYKDVHTYASKDVKGWLLHNNDKVCIRLDGAGWCHGDKDMGWD